MPPATLALAAAAAASNTAAILGASVPLQAIIAAKAAAVGTAIGGMAISGGIGLAVPRIIRRN